jgi:2-methylisocitrate lyase-like PEP mutase family enzyme
MTSQQSACAAFKSLHESGCFVIPNPWDAGSAVFLQHLGFKALATTSAGFAFSRALPDAIDALPRDMVLDHARDIAAATTLPVNVDFQNGYADDPEGVAENVALCIKTGVAGLSIEDNAGTSLYETKLAIERVAAARRAIDASGVPVLLTARCEAWLLRDPDASRIARERLAAFAEAGADCLFAPGLKDLDEVAALVKIVAPKPLNELVSAPSTTLSVASLAAAGVRRISVGSALARTAWGAFARAAETLAKDGSFDGLEGALPFATLNSIFATMRRP